MAVRSVLVAAAVLLVMTAVLFAVGTLLERVGALDVDALSPLPELLFVAGLFVSAFVGTRSGLRGGAQPRHAVVGGAVGAFALWFVFALRAGGVDDPVALLAVGAIIALAAFGGALLAARTGRATRRDLR